MTSLATLVVAWEDGASKLRSGLDAKSRSFALRDVFIM